MNLNKIVMGVTLGTALLVAAPASAATASSGHTGKVHVTFHYTSSAGPLTVTTTLKATVLPSQVRKLQAAASALLGAKPVSANNAVQPYSFPGGGGGSYPNVDCHKVYAWNVTYGTLTYQHGCGYHTAPWGWKFSTATCATMTTEASESGMLWVRNGQQMTDQAAHVYPCTFQFHGNFNPLNDGDTLSALDIYTYEYRIGGTLFAAETDVTAQLHQTSTYGA